MVSDGGAAGGGGGGGDGGGGAGARRASMRHRERERGEEMVLEDLCGCFVFKNLLDTSQLREERSDVQGSATKQLV